MAIDLDLPAPQLSGEGLAGDASLGRPTNATFLP